MTRYVVKADIGAVRGTLCSRPYPRPDHLDPFTYEWRSDALEAAAAMRARFPENEYYVTHSYR